MRIDEVGVTELGNAQATDRIPVARVGTPYPTTITPADILNNPTLTGAVTLPATTTIGGASAAGIGLVSQGISDAVGTTAVGLGSLSSVTSGISNTALGYNANQWLTTGSANITIGSGAGSYNDEGTVYGANTSNSIAIGNNATFSGNGISNSFCVGNNTSVTKSNQFVLGNAQVTETVLNGTLKLNLVPAVHTDNAAALAAGHVAGEIYRTSTGVLMVAY